MPKSIGSVCRRWSKREKQFVYYARLDRNGKSYRDGPFLTKTEANESLQKLNEQFRKGLLGDKVSFGDFARDFAEATDLENPKTAYEYRKRLKHLLPFFEKMNLGGIKAVHIRAYRKYRLSENPKPKPSTVNRELATLSKIFSVALEDERISYHPMIKRKLKLYEEKEPPKVLSDDDRIRLLAACKLDPKFEPFEAFIIAGLSTGMRVSELLRLRWADVDLENRVITVVKSKSRKPRYIPINDTLHELLMSLPRTTEYALPFPRHGDMRARFEHWFLDLCKLAGVSVRFHGMRATFATQLTDNQVPVPIVQALLGHSSPIVTQRYVRTDQSLEKAVRTLDRRQKRRQNSDEDVDGNS